MNDKILEREEKNDKRLVTQRKRKQENNFDLYRYSSNIGSYIITETTGPWPVTLYRDLIGHAAPARPEGKKR